MKLIDLNRANNFLIIGKRDACDAANLVKDLNERTSEKNFSYMSFSTVNGKHTPVVTSVSDTKEVSFANFTYESFFTKLSEETLEIIRQNSDAFAVEFNFTILYISFMDFDPTFLNKVLKGDFRTSAPDLSRKNIRIFGSHLRDTEVFHFKDAHLFDDFITRLTNFKTGTPDEFINAVKFYSRFTQ